jgi:hypothetical protein
MGTTALWRLWRGRPQCSRITVGPASTSTSRNGARDETLADCATLELAHVVFEAAIAKNPAGRFMIRSRTRVVERHPEGDW